MFSQQNLSIASNKMSIIEEFYDVLNATDNINKTSEKCINITKVFLNFLNLANSVF